MVSEKESSIARDAPAPALDLDRTLESETHTEASLEEENRNTRDHVASCNEVPSTVTEKDPVAIMLLLVNALVAGTSKDRHNVNVCTRTNVSCTVATDILPAAALPRTAVSETHTDTS